MDVDYTVAVFKKDNIKWEGQQSLKGKKVVWMRGYNYQNYLKTDVSWSEIDKDTHHITSYNVCYTKLLRWLWAGIWSQRPM